MTYSQVEEYIKKYLKDTMPFHPDLPDNFWNGLKELENVASK